MHKLRFTHSISNEPNYPDFSSQDSQKESFRFNYNLNTVCFHLPGRNTNYTLIHRRYQGITSDSNGNAALVRFSIGSEPAICYEAVISVSCLLTSTPCNSENNRTLRICDRSCQAFNWLMANTFCDESNQQVLNLSHLPHYSKFIGTLTVTTHPLTSMMI